jgi:hypothetical protein
MSELLPNGKGEPNLLNSKEKPENFSGATGGA